jgi:hypothetical protein
MIKTLFGLMLTAACCCGQGAHGGNFPPTIPYAIQYVAADSDTVTLEQQAPLDTNVVFAVVNPLTIPVVSDSQGSSYGSCSSIGDLSAHITTPFKSGMNTITVQNARAICVVELGNLIPVSGGSFGGTGFAASIGASTGRSPLSTTLWAIVVDRNSSLPASYGGIFTSMLGGKFVVGASAVSSSSYTITVPLSSTSRSGAGWSMVQVTLSRNP